ncbi:hypothetical protein [Sediminibacterium sp.]|uniref:hypothetical protein n=1 Tax=Sediminibacterium sp. TaxID=1917865 RepID=UPI00272080F1|nr:hypothetical protein [Sediminibacterium sp.]MDO9000276.1 hypothetical protein [Bacteroidota bacterium]MDP3147155.1 hypothetical protein [Bacteroidota bacterium]MDP3567316.1 hypothetical protein [Sediminibacterium sp.]
MKNKVLIIFFLFFCLSFRAQTDDVYVGKTDKDTTFRPKKKRNNDWIDKVTYGSNVQAIFGSYTYIYLSPTIGYTPFKNFNFGIGFIYSYVSINYKGYGRFSQSIYGGHSYARYFINESFFVQGQFDHLLQPNVYNIYNPSEKVWVDYALIGGGYRQSLGNKAALITSIMINATPNRLSIYPNPIIQIGFVGRF